MTHNMVCCNLDTCREKGKNFPLFTANVYSKCMTLNTYANFYFNEIAECRINTYCGMKDYVSDGRFSLEDVQKDMSEIEPDYKEALAIDELIKRNSGAGKRRQIGEPVNGFYKFNFCYKDLKGELIEEVDLEYMDRC